MRVITSYSIHYTKLYEEYSLITDEWTSPNWHIWDGGSPSYYTHNWNDNRDHWVFSTQVQSMNWIFQLDEAWKVNPDSYNFV